MKASDAPALSLYGVDFSGAKDAGNKIWIAVAKTTGAGLEVTDCFPAKNLPGSGSDRDRALIALRELIERQSHAVFGLDFPFGLPLEPADSGTWEDFVHAFPSRYPDSDAFHVVSHRRTRGKEEKRWTDKDSRTPLSAYNLRLYRQTYYGICLILRPLVEQRKACVLPMQQPMAGRPWLIEVCPASTLARKPGSPPYKCGKAGRGERSRLLASLQAKYPLSIPRTETKSAILDQGGGDAVDAVVAVVAVFRNLPLGFRPASGSESYTKIEGYVYT